MVGTSTFGNLLLGGSGIKTFVNNASSTNLTIGTGTTAVFPQLLSLSGNYSNTGTTTAGTGTTTLNGVATQTLSGTMIATSSFANLKITNTSGTGSTTQAVFFNGSASTTGTLTMIASTSALFLASASSTFQNVNLAGASGQKVWLRSATPGSRYSFYVSGTQQLVSYVDVQDNSACPTALLATNGTNVDSGNNVCWTFSLPGSAVIVSASNQTFAYQQATTAISAITVTDDATAASITAANDLRIVIATTSANMRWDTTDTTATFGGTASAKVSNPVSYLGNGEILVIPVDVDFLVRHALCRCLGACLAQCVRLRLAPPFGDSFGESRKQHREPEPDRNLTAEPDRTAREAITDGQDRDDDGHDFSDEDHGVSRKCPRVQLDEC